MGIGEYVKINLSSFALQDFKFRIHLPRGHVGDGHLSAVLRGHVAHEIDHAVRVAPLIVIPGHKLNKLVKHDASLGIKYGGDRACNEILGHKGLVGVPEEALHVTVSATLNLLADVFVCGLLTEVSSEIDNRHISGGNAESHAGKLALKGGDDLSDGLSSTSRRRNDIGTGSTATAPILLEDPSTTICVEVMACTVVMRADSMPKASLTHFTIGARPLVVHDAQDTYVMSLV